jgi:cyclic dehypoxanthinyl futalosine synthase
MTGWKAILTLQEQWSRDHSHRYRISVDDAVTLYDEAPLWALRRSANRRRKAMHPTNEVTYLIDRNVNYTNVCTINCQFCSFYRPPGHSESYTQSIDEISARFTELEAIGGSRVLMQGGVHPELPMEWYENLIAQLKHRHPSILLDCFSPIEIDGIADVTGISTLEVLTRLKQAGVDGLPGGGAEMLVDEVRNDVSPKKHRAGAWMRIMQEAQSLGLTTSATNVIGFGETNEQRIAHMDFVRGSQDESVERWDNGFTSFISWPVQLEVNSFGRRNHGQNRIELGVGASEYLRHLAISRLFLDNVEHIQASWPTMGLEVAQIGLLGGADDIGSTMMEENVVSASGTTRVEVSTEELQMVIIRAGLKPRLRNSKYTLLETPPAGEVLSELACPPPRQY